MFLAVTWTTNITYSPLATPIVPDTSSRPVCSFFPPKNQCSNTPSDTGTGGLVVECPLLVLEVAILGHVTPNTFVSDTSKHLCRPQQLKYSSGLCSDTLVAQDSIMKDVSAFIRLSCKNLLPNRPNDN